jgi:hypothetical protein
MIERAGRTSPIRPSIPPASDVESENEIKRKVII